MGMDVVELFTCLTLTFLNRSGNPATGSWQHLEKMFSCELFFIYGILYSSSEQPGGIRSIHGP